MYTNGEYVPTGVILDVGMWHYVCMSFAMSGGPNMTVWIDDTRVFDNVRDFISFQGTTDTADAMRFGKDLVGNIDQLKVILLATQPFPPISMLANLQRSGLRMGVRMRELQMIAIWCEFQITNTERQRSAAMETS